MNNFTPPHHFPYLGKNIEIEFNIYPCKTQRLTLEKILKN